MSDVLKKLNHDFLNSIAIINSISKSTHSFIDQISEKNTNLSINKIELFKHGLISIQEETLKIQSIFLKAFSNFP